MGLIVGCGPGRAGGVSKNAATRRDRTAPPPDGHHPRRMPAFPGVLAMRTLLVPAAAAAFLATSAIAFAATHNVSGTVKAFDMQAGTLTLANGTEYMLPKDFKDPGLKAGDKVTIAWDTKDGNKIAEKAKIAK